MTVVFFKRMLILQVLLARLLLLLIVIVLCSFQLVWVHPKLSMFFLFVSMAFVWPLVFSKICHLMPFFQSFHLQQPSHFLRFSQHRLLVGQSVCLVQLSQRDLLTHLVLAASSPWYGRGFLFRFVLVFSLLVIFATTTVLHRVSEFYLNCKVSTAIRLNYLCYLEVYQACQSSLILH